MMEMATPDNNRNLEVFDLQGLLNNLMEAATTNRPKSVEEIKGRKEDWRILSKALTSVSSVRHRIADDPDTVFMHRETAMRIIGKKAGVRDGEALEDFEHIVRIFNLTGDGRESWMKAVNNIRAALTRPANTTERKTGGAE